MTSKQSGTISRKDGEAGNKNCPHFLWTKTRGFIEISNRLWYNEYIIKNMIYDIRRLYLW